MIIFQPDRHLLKKFVTQHAHKLTGYVLDIGGQDGKRYGGYITKADPYIVLDPYAKYKPDIVAYAEEIPLPDAKADNMMCIEVLMDVYEIQKAISEMARVLKPGGNLVATMSFNGPLCDEPYHFWRGTPHSLLKLLEPYFENIIIENRGHYRLQKCQNWIRYWINRLDLYNRPILGRLFSYCSQARFAMAQWGDTRDTSDSNRKFAIGYNILATRK